MPMIQFIQGDNMPNLHLPVAALFFSTLLIIVYFFKKRINLLENKLYSVMLIVILIDSLLSSMLFFNVYNNYNRLFVEICNKIDYLQLIAWISCMYLYTYTITHKKNERFNQKFKINLISIIIINIFISILIFIADIDIILISPIKQTAQGDSVNIAYFTWGFYMLLCGIVTIFNLKKINRKYIPIFISLFLSVILFIIFSINPYLIVISICLTFINWVMYHTIENPDLRLVEEIKQAKERSDEINADKSNFLFNITREIKKRSLEMKSYISESFDSNDIDDIKSNLYKLQSTLDGANKMINQTLNISEEDIIKIEKIDNKYNIKNLIKEITLSTQTKIKENIDFRVSVENNIPEYLFGDSIKIKQILKTILENAIKYTEKGFIELRIDSIIKYEICRLIITLEDSGVGMENSVINNIFTKRNDNDYTTKHLNLNSVNKIINLIGGTFNIISKLNQGTKITITLDQYIPEEETKNDQISEYIKDLTMPKVLLVDEDLKKLEKIKKMFKNQHIYVDTVIIGEQCLRKIRNNEKFDLIIIDYEIPKLNGLQVFNKLKAEGYKIPVIITTDSDDDNIKEKYKKIGIYDVIKNPIKKKDIEKIIKFLKENQNES